MLPIQRTGKSLFDTTKDGKGEVQFDATAC